jgi:hypothetical protein
MMNSSDPLMLAAVERKQGNIRLTLNEPRLRIVRHQPRRLGNG